MELRIHEVRQNASGGSYVVIYEAGVELLARPGIDVEIASVDPPNCPPEMVQMARQAIAAGADEVLRPRAMGAFIRVRTLVINHSDFKPLRFTQLTNIEFEKLLARHQASNELVGGTPPG